ncbi:hypothetical protein niasHS_014280 [Heterodera schachtii]|uniref:Uncharacterized protein n=1 Tax=Heterodera schachtii TaxID=97005 RepID=A0ABD2IC81_HETSC
MIMSSSSTTSSSSSSQSAIGGGAIVERIQRVELLRAELDRSLKMAAAAASLNSATAKRSPLCILFRAADSVHIQFSGSARSSSIDLFAKPRSAAVTAPSSAGNAITGAISRFTVSPTPNAVPPAAFGSGDSPKFCNNDRGTGSQVTTALLPRSLSSLSVLTTATSAAEVAANANNNRHGDDGGGGANNGRAGGDNAAAASAAIAAAELLAPPPPIVAAEKDEEKDSNGKTTSTVDFVVPPPSSIDGREEDGAETVPPSKPSPVAEGTMSVAASSPATSVDSGVASPGAAADYLLLNGSSSSLRAKESTATDKSEQYNNTNKSANSPCWATVPRTRRRIFNFGTIISGDINGTASNGSPLIDALTLSSTMSSCSNICTTTTGASAEPQKTGQHSSMSSMAPMPSLTLQRPPLKKKYGQPNTTTDCEQQSLSQLCQPSSNVSSSSSPYGYNNVNSFNSMATTVNGNAASLVAPLSPPKTGPSGPQVAIVSAKLIITSNGIEKEGDQMSTAASAARRTPLSVVQTAGGAVHRQLSDSMCYKSGHNSNGSGNENNDGGADSDTTLDRSAAYCGDGLPPRSATMPPLRSILKKPRAPQPPSPVPANNDTTLLMMMKMAFANGSAASGQQQLQQHQQPNRFTMVPSPMPRNHLRRVPTRLVLERSVSDSVLDDAAIPDDQFSALQHSAAAAFNASILRRLSSSSSTMSPGGGLLGSFDEQLEDNIVDNKTEQFMHQQQQGSNGNGGNNSSSSSSCPSSCSSETIDTDGSAQSAAPAPIVKKRVSFSECVHARYFRSNSSILGQKKKNEKKSRKRTSRRCNSDIVHPSDEVSSQQQQSSSSSTLSQHNHHNDCDESCPWIVWKH